MPHRPRPAHRPARRTVRPDRCPPGTYEPHIPDVLYVGRDDFGNDRYLPLRGLTGICVSGLPGYGKTSLIASWLCQLTPTLAAQFALLDGKDGGDQEPWHDRAWRHSGDQLPAALDLLEDQHAEMRRRLRTIVSLCGQRNAWMLAARPKTCRSWSPLSTNARPTSTSPSTKATASWKASPGAASPWSAS
jgi:hypothetical protein